MNVRNVITRVKSQLKTEIRRVGKHVGSLKAFAIKTFFHFHKLVSPLKKALLKKDSFEKNAVFEPVS